MVNFHRVAQNQLAHSVLFLIRWGAQITFDRLEIPNFVIPQTCGRGSKEAFKSQSVQRSQTVWTKDNSTLIFETSYDTSLSGGKFLCFSFGNQLCEALQRSQRLYLRI